MTRIDADTQWNKGHFGASATLAPKGLVGISLTDKTNDDFAFSNLHFTPESALDIADAIVAAALEAKPELADEYVPERQAPKLVEGAKYRVVSLASSDDPDGTDSYVGLLVGDIVTCTDTVPDADGDVLFNLDSYDSYYLLPTSVEPVEEKVDALSVFNVFNDSKPGLPPVDELPINYVMDVVNYVASRAPKV